MIDWHNENAHRTYPIITAPGRTATYIFTDSSTANIVLPNGIILDLVIVAGHGLGLSADDTIYLDLIRLTEDAYGAQFIVFEFVASHEPTSPLLFFCPLAIDEFVTVYGSAGTDECQQLPAWEGWLTVGSLSQHFVATGLATIICGEEFVVEPACVQNIYGTLVTGITLANASRLIARPPSDCEQPTLPTSPSVIAAQCLTGHITFVEGFNAKIHAVAGENALVFSAVRGAGAGEPTEEVPLYAAETSPDGGLLLTGGPRCDEVISTINGIPGPAVPILAGIGVNIGPAEGDEHTLVVAVTLQGLAICPEADALEPREGSGSSVLSVTSSGDGLTPSTPSAGSGTTILSVTSSGDGFSNYNNVWLGGAVGNVWQYNGVTWSQHSGAGRWETTQINGIYAATLGDVWLCGNDGHVWQRSGDIWTQHAGTGRWGTVQLNALAIDASGNVWVGGHNGNLWVYDGTTWTQHSGDGRWATNHLLHIEPTTYGDVWVSGRWGELWQYSGGVWTQVDKLDKWYNEWVQHVRVLAADNIWVATAYDGVWHYNGTTWFLHTAIDRWAPGSIRTCDATVTDDIWIGATAGNVWRYDNINWSQIDASDKWGDIAAKLHVSAEDDVWVFGNTGQVWHYDGTAWTQHSGMGRWHVSHIFTLHSDARAL